MTVFAHDVAEATSAGREQRAEYRAGGTDVNERRRSGVTTGDVVDITGLAGLAGVHWGDGGGVRIGALVTAADLARDARLAAGYPALSRSAAALATPQIREVGTLGGNLAQRSRCWYYRNPHTTCLKKGGDSCPARDGNHLYGVAFDTGPCVWPHPSTLGAALLTYDAEVEVTRSSRPAEPQTAATALAVRSVAGLYGDGSDGRDHVLGPGELITGVRLPAPVPGERAAYRRAISRSAAEWPLVEAVTRLVLDGGTVVAARVAIGGVAPVPLRLPAVEDALTGLSPTSADIRAAADLARDGARPLPQTGYKVPLMVGTVAAAIEDALTGP